MALGGMYDLVGGGFHRYSVDERWLVPHFEKMLYDNALLAPAYLHGWLVSATSATARSPRRPLDYVLRELALEGGGFASAQDADTDGVEGLRSRGRAAGGAPDELLQLFERDRFVLRGELDEELRAQLHASATAAAAGARRQGDRVVERPRARGPRRVRTRSRPRRTGSTPARRLGEFLLGPLSTAHGRLHRTWREGVAKGTGYLEDYADVANGLYELHVATGELRWLREAHRLATLAVEPLRRRDDGGFFQTPRDGEHLVARKKDLDDHPAPSGNAMLSYVLLRLARIFGDDELERRAVSLLRLIRDAVMRAPSAFAWSLVALDLHLAAAARDRDRRGPSTPMSPRRRSRVGTPRRWSRSGPPTTSRCSREGPRRRQARRLRLRALRLPRSRDGSGGPRCLDRRAGEAAATAAVGE